MDGSPRSERLRLRFVTRRELPLVHQRYEYEPGGFNDFGLSRGATPAARGNQPGGSDEATRDDGELRDDGALRDDERGMFFIERVNEGSPVQPPIGTISYHRVRFGPNPESSAWMIGIELLPEARGRGFGAEAQRALADWLFETTSLNRVQAETDIENLAEARSLEKAGFTREGVLRGAQFRAGAYHDLVVYSRLRSDPR